MEAIAYVALGVAFGICAGIGISAAVYGKAEKNFHNNFKQTLITAAEQVAAESAKVSNVDDGWDTPVDPRQMQRLDEDVRRVLQLPPPGGGLPPNK